VRVLTARDADHHPIVLLDQVEVPNGLSHLST
jgi:hypothetical protein